MRIRHRMAALLIRLVQRVRVYWYATLSTNTCEGAPICYQPVQFCGRGKIAFERAVRIGVSSSPGFLSTYGYIEARRESAKIIVREGTWISNGFTCIAEHQTIEVGRDCLIGSDVEIFDSDFHGLRVGERKRSDPDRSASVLIGNNVFLGSHVRVMKGSSIGDGAVVANSSLVAGNIPPNTLAAGVPAKVVRELDR